jgi:hypothetical protein
MARARRGCAALISSFPIRSRAGKWEIARNVPINDFIRSKSMRRSLNWRKKNRSSAI